MENNEPKEPIKTATDALLEKSRALREKSKITSEKLTDIRQRTEKMNDSPIARDEVSSAKKER